MRVDDWPALVFLHGIGNPGVYLALLLALTALGVWSVFSREAADSLPCGVACSDNVEKAVANLNETTPGYSAWVMSVATLLPGDVLGYLKTYEYQPTTVAKAIGTTVFQLCGLLVQILLGFSILALMR